MAGNIVFGFLQPNRWRPSPMQAVGAFFLRILVPADLENKWQQGRPAASGPAGNFAEIYKMAILLSK
jgi:hypothetical protein